MVKKKIWKTNEYQGILLLWCMCSFITGGAPSSSMSMCAIQIKPICIEIHISDSHTAGLSIPSQVPQSNLTKVSLLTLGWLPVDCIPNMIQRHQLQLIDAWASAWQLLVTKIQRQLVSLCVEMVGMINNGFKCTNDKVLLNICTTSLIIVPIRDWCACYCSAHRSDLVKVEPIVHWVTRYHRWDKCCALAMESKLH